MTKAMPRSAAAVSDAPDAAAADEEAAKAGQPAMSVSAQALNFQAPPGTAGRSVAHR